MRKTNTKSHVYAFHSRCLSTSSFHLPLSTRRPHPAHLFHFNINTIKKMHGVVGSDSCFSLPHVTSRSLHLLVALIHSFVVSFGIELIFVVVVCVESSSISPFSLWGFGFFNCPRPIRLLCIGKADNDLLCGFLLSLRPMLERISCLLLVDGRLRRRLVIVAVCIFVRLISNFPFLFQTKFIIISFLSVSFHTPSLSVLKKKKSLAISPCLFLSALFVARAPVLCVPQ